MAGKRVQAGMERAAHLPVPILFNQFHIPICAQRLSKRVC